MTWIVNCFKVLKTMTRDERIEHCKIISNRLALAIVVCVVSFFLIIKNVTFSSKTTKEPTGKTIEETEIEIKRFSQDIDQLISYTAPTTSEKGAQATTSHKNEVTDVKNYSPEEKLKIIHSKLIDIKNQLNNKK